MGNLKGTARRTEEYLAKKKHPIRWRISHFLKMLAKGLTKDKDLYIRKGI